MDKPWVTAKRLLTGQFRNPNLTDDELYQIIEHFAHYFESLINCFDRFLYDLADPNNNCDDVEAASLVYAALEKSIKRAVRRTLLIWRLCKCYIQHACRSNCFASTPESCPVFTFYLLNKDICNKHQFSPVLSVYVLGARNKWIKEKLLSVATELQQTQRSLPAHCCLAKGLTFPSALEHLLPLLSWKMVATLENVLWWDYERGHVYPRFLPTMGSLENKKIIAWLQN